MAAQTTEKIYGVLIAEDEIHASNLIGEYVEKTRNLETLDFAYSGQKTIDKVLASRPDILLLDINFPDMTGISVLEKLKALGVKLPKVIITTSHNEYALKGFELGVCDYLPKPFAFERFSRAIDRAKLQIEEEKIFANETGNLVFREKGDHVILPYKKIHYLTSVGKHTNIFTAKNVYSPSILLKDVFSELPAELFARIHRQHVVNIKFVSRIRYDAGGRYLAHIRNEKKDVLPVGAVFAKEFRTRIVGILGSDAAP